MNNIQTAGVETPLPAIQTRLLIATRRWLLTLLVAATPVIVSCFLVTARGHNLTDFKPHISDEVSNWHQSLTFKAVGFNGGYYTLHELPPAASFTHFYVYGPWFPMIYGSVARLIGWELYSPLIVNTLFLVLAIILFCRTLGLDNRQLVLTGFALFSFYGLMSYLFSGMQETFQQSLAILLAAVFYRALTHPSHSSIGFRILGIMLIGLAALTRMSWVILFLPFLLLTSPKKGGWLLVNFGLSLIVVALVVKVWQFVGAPGYNYILSVFSLFSISFTDGVVNVAHAFVKNALRFVDLSKSLTYLLQSFLVIVFMVAAYFSTLRLYRLRYSRNSIHWSESAFHLVNLAGIVCATFALYIVEDDIDYRVIAPHLLLSLLLLIPLKRYRPLMAFVGISLLFFPTFVSDYQSTINKFDPEPKNYAAFKQIAEEYIHYDPQSPSPWCNTLLFYVSDYHSSMLSGTPAGIGLSFFRDAELPFLKFKSRYLLLNAKNYDLIIQRPDAPQLEWLADGPTSSLYLNRSAACKLDAPSS